MVVGSIDRPRRLAANESPDTQDLTRLPPRPAIGPRPRRVGGGSWSLSLTLLHTSNTLQPTPTAPDGSRLQETAIVTKKEIVKRISEEIGLTQLKTKDIVQRTLDAIIETLVSEGRIELRNFGVFEVKQRAPRKARNPRTGAKVSVPAKNVVTFKPGKEMEELVRKMNPENLPLLDEAEDADEEGNGPVEGASKGLRGTPAAQADSTE
ncbi:MAG TPA: HU family DNA-binding protein [Isosphaeraceae bacterium]|nr:HU family DNA-binding protein [Isosphaeraceae bacterium]